MAEKPAQERTEEATPKHLQEARERGEVARSVELTSATLLLASVLLFYFIGEDFLQKLSGVIRTIYSSLDTVNINPGNIPALAKWAMGEAADILGPLLIMVLLLALLVNYLQIGVIFAPKALNPKWSRVSPAAGLKRIFSTKGLVELIKGILKLLIIGTIIYVYLAERVKDYPFLTYMTPLQTIGVLANDIFKIGLYVGIAFVALAVADFTFQKWEYKRQLRMSKQEVKEEAKQTEGSPEMRARIRTLQRDMSRNRMMTEVARATVVITNPAHVAVALRYNEEEGLNAPLVVAKGQRKMAERIKAIARKNDIPVRESPPLARALYQTCEPGDTIPDNFYQAVAELLAEIFWEQHAAA